MTIVNTPYDTDFYLTISPGARQSAMRVLPLVVDLIRPRRVVDVGCGTAGWLLCLSQISDCEILGVDGAYMPEDQLAIPRECFTPSDLGESLALEGQFDLAMSLEVAEHLPLQRAAGFVDDLTALAPAVLFSAAVPHQGGVGHVNEQWQSYWIDLFEKRGFATWDVVRPALWNCEDVAFWYRQNTFLFVDPSVHGERPQTQPAIADLVHPELFRVAVQSTPSPSLREVLTQLPIAARRSVNHRFAQLRSGLQP